MRPKERRETGAHDLFRSRLDQTVDLDHALVKLAWAINSVFLEQKFGEVDTDKPGHPPLPTRLMGGLASLRRTYGQFERGVAAAYAAIFLTMADHRFNSGTLSPFTQLRFG
jgi:hypothetical protein